MSKKRSPLFLASFLRIVATGCIFCYHFLVLSKYNTYHLATIGLNIFFFLSGWFGVYGDSNPGKWLLKRVRRIMIPYWPVIFVVLIANRVVGYKETTLLKDILTFFGFSMFLDNPVYIISWFITMIVMLYLSLAGYKAIKSKVLKLAYLFALYFLFLQVIPHKVDSVLLFYGGYFLSSSMCYLPKLPNIKTFKGFERINENLFLIQNYTYSFFLIHGAVLIFVFRILKLSEIAAFAISLSMSLIGAYIHNKMLRRFS